METFYFDRMNNSLNNYGDLVTAHSVLSIYVLLLASLYQIYVPEQLEDVNASIWDASIWGL